MKQETFHWSCIRRLLSASFSICSTLFLWMEISHKCDRRLVWSTLVAMRRSWYTNGNMRECWLINPHHPYIQVHCELGSFYRHFCLCTFPITAVKCSTIYLPLYFAFVLAFVLCLCSAFVLAFVLCLCTFPITAVKCSTIYLPLYFAFVLLPL